MERDNEMSRLAIRFSKPTILTYFRLSCAICFLGLFITASVLRYSIFRSNVLRTYSPLLFIGVILIFITDKKNDCKFGKDRWGDGDLFCYFVLLLTSLGVVIYTHSWSKNFALLLSVIFPSIVVLYRFRSEENYRDIFSMFMCFLNVSVYLMLITGFLDVCLGFKVSYWIAHTTGIDSLIKQASFKRCVTYMGHPLYATEIYLSYYIFKHIECKINNRKENIACFIISLLGVALTQSKTGIVLLAASFLVLNIKNIRYMGIVLLLIGVCYLLGIFDSVIDRFMLGIQTGDITSARNTVLFRLLSSGQLQFGWFKMQSLADFSASSKVEVALEYSVLRWAFRFGLLITIPLVLIAYLLPIIKLVKKKSWDLLVCLMVIIIDVNSYAGIGDAGNKALHYYIMAALIINAANITKCHKGGALYGAKEYSKCEVIKEH